MEYKHTIISFSHLRWDFVYQRPQHLLSRLAAGSDVVFIEEPAFSSEPEPHWELHRPESNVLVCRPCTPSRTPGFSDEQMPYLRTLMGELLDTTTWRTPSSGSTRPWRFPWWTG